MAQILVIDDQEDIVQLVVKALELQNHKVTGLTSVLDLNKNSLPRFDLILLDIMMPDVDGLQFCHDIRDQVDCPILFITAKTQEADIVQGLTYGADDYICKPFDIHELLARIKVQLRQYEPKQRQLIYKDWTIDLDLMTLNAAGQSIDLTSLEFKIIELFMRYPQKVFTKENIYEYVWEDDYVVGDKTIHVHISNIRTKLKSTGTDHYIQTVWGMGFKLID